MATKKKAVKKPAKEPAKKGISVEAAIEFRNSRKKDIVQDFAPFYAPAVPAPGVTPKGFRLAMDDANSLTSWASTTAYGVGFNEGWVFLGYPLLAELAQVPEYRLIAEVISTEMVRKWIKIQSTNDDGADTDKIAELDAEFQRLNVRDVFRQMVEVDAFFGRAHIFLNTGDNDDRDELRMPIGDGTTELTKQKLQIGQLRSIKVIEPTWTYPTHYNASDPLADDWYHPTVWYVMTKEIHESRLLTFIGRPVPDIKKPAFSFGGLSLIQMAKPYVDNWIETRQSVNDLVEAFSTMVLKTDMSTILQGGASQSLTTRLDLFNSGRSNRGVFALNKDTEDFSNVSVPLGTLDKLQAQAQEHICSISRLPLVKYTGISPTGLNASTEGELQTFYDTIHSYQERFFDPHLRTIFRLAQINLWGEVDPDLTFSYEPLWELNAEQLATKRKTEAETDGILIDKGVLHPIEARQRLADDPGSNYLNLDVEDVPEPMMPEPEHIMERTTEEFKENKSDPTYLDNAK